MPTCAHCGGAHASETCHLASWDAPTELQRVPAAGAELQRGMLVGEYRLVEKIGEGGMGEVWSGLHPLLGRRAAIKVMHATGTRDTAARFLKEAQAASRVHHLNVVDVYGYGQLGDGRSYLVMEFLEGESLAKRIARGALGFDEAMPIVEGILAGLRASHERGVVHRDLKPENVWLLTAEEGRASATCVKLLDFGLAKVVAGPDGGDSGMTRAGAPLGTPAYMSPEQCRGVKEVDARSDLYALGVILYQMFAGKVPFSGESYVDVINQHLSAEPPSLAERIGMPAALEGLIRTAMAKRREDRFESAAQMRGALAACGAAGWVPKRAAAEDTSPRLEVRPSSEDTTTMRPAAPREPTLQPEAATPPPPRKTALERSELLGELTVQSELRGSTLTVAFCGELDREDAGELLAGFLAELTEAIDGRVERVVVDVESLSFLNSGGFAQFATWLAELKRLRERGLAPTTIRYSNGVRWQVTAMATLQRTDSALNVEATD